MTAPPRNAFVPDSNLKELVRQTIQTHLFTDCSLIGDYKPLILDPHGTRILSAVFTTSEVISANIALIEDLNRKRQPLPLEVIYFIAPTHLSISRLLQDFETTPPRYSAAHVFFTDNVPDELFALLRSSRSLAKYTRTLKELALAFVPYESQVFSLDFKIDQQLLRCSPIAQKRKWSTRKRKDKGNRRSKGGPGTDAVMTSLMPSRTSLEETANQLATVCVALGQLPTILYRVDADGSNQLLAHALKAKLTYFLSHEHLDGSGAQLLILDRPFDLTTPLLHDLTLQSMIYDLLSVENDAVSFTEANGTGKQTTQHVIFDETFSLWADFRHLHIAEVNRKLPERLRAFTSQHNLMEGSSNHNVQTDMKLLSRIIRQLPDYQKRKAEYNAILRLAEECVDRYSAYVKKMCLVEQDIATGVEVTGKPVTSLSAILRKLTDLFLDTNITPTDRLRIILLFILANSSSGGVSEDQLETVYRHTQLTPADQAVVANLRVLLSSATNFRYPRKKSRLDADTYHSARWTPVLKDLLEDTLEGRLVDQGKGTFAYLDGQPEGVLGVVMKSLRTGVQRAVGNQQSEQATSKDVLKRPKLIVYIRGGLTYPEMRTAYEVSKMYANGQVYVGSNILLTPAKFVESLRQV